MKSFKKMSEEAIHELEFEYISKLTICPGHFSYLTLLQSLKELHFHKAYELVMEICKVTKKSFEN